MVAIPIESIAFLLSADMVSVTRLATMDVISVDAAHIQVSEPTFIGMKGKSVSAAARIRVIKRIVKGIDHIRGGSLRSFTRVTIRTASPIHALNTFSIQGCYTY